MNRRPVKYCDMCETLVWADDVHSCYDAKALRAQEERERALNVAEREELTRLRDRVLALETALADARRERDDFRTEWERAMAYWNKCGERVDQLEREMKVARVCNDSQAERINTLTLAKQTAERERDEARREKDAMAAALSASESELKATYADWKVAVGLLDEARDLAHENAERADAAERERDAMRAVVEAADEWEVARVQATAARMVAGATGGPVPAPAKSETLANMRLVSALRAYRAAAQTGEP